MRQAGCRGAHPFRYDPEVVSEAWKTGIVSIAFIMIKGS
jgi:hypothetical protein